MGNNQKLLTKLKELEKLFSGQNFQFVVTGGLGLAGFIGSFYRDFFDLDVTVIGQFPYSEGIDLLKKRIVESGGEIAYEDIGYFQCKIDDIQVDILYVQQDISGGVVAYKTAKQKITGSEELLKPIEVNLADNNFLVFRPEIAVVEKLVGSVTLHQIRTKDIQDLEIILPKLKPALLFEAINIKFIAKADKLENTAF